MSFFEWDGGGGRLNIDYISKELCIVKFIARNARKQPHRVLFIEKYFQYYNWFSCEQLTEISELNSKSITCTKQIDFLLKMYNILFFAKIFLCLKAKTNLNFCTQIISCMCSSNT